MEERRMIEKLMGYIKLLKMGAAVKGPAEGFLKELKTDPDGDGPKPANWKSTEFWVAQAVPQIALIWGGLQGILPAKVWVTGSVSLAAVYLLARTGVKVVREIQSTKPLVDAIKAIKAGDLD